MSKQYSVAIYTTILCIYWCKDILHCSLILAQAAQIHNCYKGFPLKFYFMGKKIYNNILIMRNKAYFFMKHKSIF